MSSAKSRDIPKGNTKGGGGGGANKTGNRNTGKGDIKSDKVDLNPKIQATAEQMQIARIIESHRSEDPELQKKIKKLIEVTGSTLDEASMALHSRDNNLEDAITLLTEGGTESLELEWEQAGKKKKVKSAAQKADAAKEQQGGQKKENGPGGRERTDRRNDRDTRPDRGDRERLNSEEQQGDGSFDSRRGGGRGRGRGEIRGGRGGGGGMGRGGLRVENKENDESGDRGGFGAKFSNGPLRGRGRGGGGRGGFRGGDRDRDASRTFASRARGPREDDFGHHTIDVWENSQADTKAESKTNLKVDQWSEFPPAEDWDNEEYTGSLAESKVFVASTTQLSGTEGAVPQPTPPNGESHLATDTTSNGIAGPTNHLGSGNNVVAGQSIDLSLLLSKTAPAPITANPGANLLASIQSVSYSSAAAQQTQGSQPLPPRPKVSATQSAGGAGRPTQRTTGPLTKIPTSGVEMPDDSVAKLDVQFGGLDFGTTGSAFNSVVQQHSASKVSGSGDMMYGNVPPQSSLGDSYGAAGEKDMVQNKSAAQVDSGSAFQSQRGNAQVQQPNSGTLLSDSMSKSVSIPPSNLDSAQLGGLSSVQSQNQPQKAPISQTSQQQSQQPSSYTNAAAGSHGSAFVTYNTKPAPGFPAPGFPPVISQTQAGPGGYNTVPTGQMYGSQPIMTQTQHQPSSGYSMGLSTYGTLPIASSSVQPSHIPGQTIPNQNLTQMSNTGYGVPPGGIQYQSASTIPNSAGYNTSGSTYNNPYQKMSQMTTTGQLPGTKETVNDVGNANAAASTPSTQLGTSNLQGSSTSSGAGKLTSNASTTGSTTSKLQSTTGGGTTAGSMPPGMVITPQYIVNQGAIQGMPMYGFQGPMYGYDENQVQFLPRLPHPAALAAGYFDANASSFTPGGSGRSDGSSLQSYPGSDARFPRSDSSAASPVPSNLAGQTTQPMYNIPQGAQYYYLGNNAMMHPGAFAQYAPPQMYPTTGLVTPNNPSSGAPHTVSNHQYQNKGVSYGNSYINPYDTTPQTGLTNVTDYVNKNTSYTSGSGVGGGGAGQSSSATGGKGSASSTGSSQQTTDMSSSMYGNKGHLNKMNPYEKQQYGGGGSSSSYNSMGQQANQMGVTGMGAPYYMPQQAPDGTGQRQGGQPKGGKQQQYGQQQYWGGN